MSTNKEHRKEASSSEGRTSHVVIAEDEGTKEAVTIKVEPHRDDAASQQCDYCSQPQSTTSGVKLVVCSTCAGCPKFHEGSCWEAFHKALPPFLKRTAHHIATDVCLKHSSPIEFFCTFCKEAGCAHCMMASHATSHGGSVERITEISTARHAEAAHIREQLTALGEQFGREGQGLKTEIERLQGARGTLMLKRADAQRVLTENREVPVDPVPFYRQLDLLYRSIQNITAFQFSAQNASNHVEISNGGKRAQSQSSEVCTALAGPPTRTIQCRIKIGAMKNRSIFIGVFSGKFSSSPISFCSSYRTSFGFSCRFSSNFADTGLWIAGTSAQPSGNTTPPWIASFESNDELTLSLSPSYMLSLHLARTAMIYTINAPLPAAEYFICVGMNGSGDSVEILY